MKKLIYAAVITVALVGCESQSFKEHGFDEYDGEFEWTQLTKHADWPERYGHAALEFNNKLWIFGGYNPGIVRGDTYFEDVWSSEDGVSWELIQADAPWKGRRGHRVINFDDGSGEAMFLIGGFRVDEQTGYREYANDVWKSTNGKDWEEIKARTEPEITSSDDWYPRFNHAVVKATHDGENYIYIIGGASMMDSVSARYAMKYFNDVWRSTNAVDWTKIEANDFGIRSEAGAAVDPSTGKIFIQGGVHGVIFESLDQSSHPIKDWHMLWSSSDGENWAPEMDTAGFDEGLLWRSDHHLVFFQNALWALPGKTTSNMHYHYTSSTYYPMWKKAEDLDLQVDSYGIDIDPRHGYATAIMNEKLFIMGGYTSRYGQSNDVWTGEIK